MSAVRAYAPGRTEIAGNHTDHQGGRVVAAAVSCGIEMEIEPIDGMRAHVESEGFAPFEIALDEGERPDERGTTQSLVRGVVAGLRHSGVPVGGFAAKARSTVPSGGGLSSSAAFELALGAGLERLFAAADAEPAGPVALALIGQAAERDYFGKPCGLMDQLAVACGGVCAFDFASPGQPEVEQIDFDLSSFGYELCLVDTHCDHSLYTQEYAQVAQDMGAVAAFMGAPMLSQVPEAAFVDRFDDVRAELGDLPALRGLHYYHEMKLVDARIGAMRAGDVSAFLDATRRSAASSAQFLQNVSTFDRASQPAMVALALCELLLEGEGAARIHGGGFGGSIQAFVPADRVASFQRQVDAHLGEGSCQAYRIAPEGARAERL